jgi:nucleotide-binding universal stress UspA family protein
VVECAENALKRLFLEAEEGGVQVESITETGELVQQVARTVLQESIDLVFASTRREDVERRFYAGSRARRLSLHLPCSVALVRVVHAGKIRADRILVPLKARVEDREARAFFIGRMAEEFGARVLLFHAPRPMTRLFRGEVHLTPVEWHARLPEDLSEFVKQLANYRIHSEDRIAPGSIARGIRTEAAFGRHDLIIIGPSQRSLVSSLMHGNPVEDLLRETPCNLIILKTAHER